MSCRGLRRPTAFWRAPTVQPATKTWARSSSSPYRAPVDYPTTVYLDNFRRGTSFAEVDPAG